MGLKKVSTFPERLKEAIGERRHTEIAENIGITKQAISMYLSGTRHPYKPIIEALARELNVNPAWLMGYDVPKILEKSKEESNDISEILSSLIDRLTYHPESLTFCGKQLDNNIKDLLKLSLEHVLDLILKVGKKN